MKTFRHLQGCAQNNKETKQMGPFYNLSKFHFFNFYYQRMNPERQSKEYLLVELGKLKQLQYDYFQAIQVTWCDKMNSRLGDIRCIFESMTCPSTAITMVSSSPLLALVLPSKQREV